MTKLALPNPIPTGPWSAATAAAIQQNFERIYGSSGRIGQGGGAALANGLDLITPVPGDMIVCTSSGIFVALSLVTTAQRVLTNNSGTPTWALVDLTDGVTGVLPLANFYNATTTKRVLGRNSASGGVWEEVTASQLLDWIGSAAQGDILFRGASGWELLSAGTAGYFLQTAGASADPVWAGVTGNSQPIAFANHTEFWFALNGSFIALNGVTGTATGTTLAYPAAGSIDADGPFFQLGTGGTTNSTAQCTSGTSGALKQLSFAWDFDLSFVFKTDHSDITTVRYMIGMGVNNENTDTLANNWIGFRYSTAVPDGGWVGVTYDGTQAVTATVAAIAANTRYVLRIRKVSGTVFFSVNGGTEVSTSSNVPTNNAYASIGARVTTLANAVRSLWFSRLWVDYGL